MYNFNISKPLQWQLYAKYCIKLDERISSVQNFIDTFSPNYLILNYDYGGGKTFYTTEELQTEAVNIVSIENNTIYVNINNLMPHQVLYNNFGQDIYIRLLQNNNWTLTQYIIPQGYGIVKKDYNDFYVMSLDAMGDFYILNSCEIDGQGIVAHFILKEKAVLTYGTDYNFSLAPDISRWIYRSLTPENPDYTLKKIDSSILSLVAKSNDYKIALESGELWQQNRSILSYDILQEQDRGNVSFHLEEVFCDDTHNSLMQDGAGNYIIDLHLNDQIGILDNLYINFY